jgi:hypothetical protein
MRQANGRFGSTAVHPYPVGNRQQWVEERTRSRGKGARRGQRIFDEVMRGSA